MSKYALTWTTDRGYMPGTNAILNALELYEYSKDVDVHIRYWGDYHDLGEEYLSQWPDVHWSNIDGLWNPGRNPYWYLVLDDYHYAYTELTDYDCVCYWGADLCILNNWEEYFEISTKLDRLVISTNEHFPESIGYNNMTPKDQWPYIHTWSVPYADGPLFVPKSKMHIVKEVVDMQLREGVQVDRMDGLNYVIRDNDENPIILPGVMWANNAMSWTRVVDAGKYVLFCNSKLNAFHRKYWNSSYLQMYVHDRDETARHNGIVFNRKWNMFNSECRVKWTEGIDLWDGKFSGNFLEARKAKGLGE